MMWLYRARCWWRGFHKEAGQAGFQYGLNGYCDDCGKVGDGINSNDDAARSDDDEAIFSAIGLLLAHGYAITPPRFQQLDSKSAPSVETRKVAVTIGFREP